MAEYVPPNELPCPGLHTCYYSKFFLLRMPVEVNGKSARVKLNSQGGPVLSYCPERGRDITLSLSLITKSVAKVLNRYGVYHVDTFYYCDVPMFSLTFSSEDELRRFVSIDKNNAEQAIQDTLSDLFDRRFTYLRTPKFVQQAHSKHIAMQCRWLISVTVDINLLLVTPPHAGNSATDFNVVTPANIHTVYSQWDASTLFTFEDINSVFRTVRNVSLHEGKKPFFIHIILRVKLYTSVYRRKSKSKRSAEIAWYNSLVHIWD